MRDTIQAIDNPAVTCGCVLPPAQDEEASALVMQVGGPVHGMLREYSAALVIQCAARQVRALRVMSTTCVRRAA